MSDCRLVKQSLNRPGSEQQTCRRRAEADTARAVPPVLRIADDGVRRFRGKKHRLFSKTALFEFSAHHTGQPAAASRSVFDNAEAKRGGI